MNTKIIDYRLIHYGGSRGYSTSIEREFQKQVESHIAEGWEPLGGVAGGGGFCGDQEYTWLYQAMVKRATE